MHTPENDVRRPWAGRARCWPSGMGGSLSVLSLGAPIGHRASWKALAAIFLFSLTACGTGRIPGSGYSARSAAAPRPGRAIPLAPGTPAPGALIPASSKRLRAHLLAAGPQRAEKPTSLAGR